MDKDNSLNIERYFTKDIGEGTVYDMFEWDKRYVQIKNTEEEIIYDGKELEFPTTWSDTAAKVVGSKYFFIGGNEKNPIEKSAKQLIHRVSDAITKKSVEQKILSEEESKIFYDELSNSLLNQRFSFNSPVWFNVGLYEQYGIKEKRAPDEKPSHWAIDKDGNFTKQIDAYERPQASACFIQSIGDNMESILTHAKKEGTLFKYGSGTGTNFSNLRGINEPLSSGGVASGEISFLRIYDIIAGRIQSGGKTRRAAKMVITDDDHPDLMRFIMWKVNEERKALWLSMNPEWAPRDAADLESEAYKTVDGQNGNNSVRISDEFMKAALDNRKWDLNFRTAKKFKEEVEIPLSEYKEDRYLPDKRFIKDLTNKRKTINAREALELIARAAYVTGDPGVQFDTRMNEWHTCPNSGKQNATNPCSEFSYIDDSACNLASINLIKYLDDKGNFDTKAFKETVKLSIISQETLIDYSSYPSKEIAINSHLHRPLGLGYANLGALLISQGIAYDSDEGRSINSAITSLMTAKAYETSAELASKLGAFSEFEKNREPMLNVIKKHYEHTKKVKRREEGLETAILKEAEATWQKAIEKGEKDGFRNAQTTLLAPTGTISFMMDSECTGMEPLLGLKTTKGLAGGGKLERSVASCVFSGLEKLSYKGNDLDKILDYIEEEGTVVGAPQLEKEHYDIFATSLSTDNNISVDGHLLQMQAAQPFLSGAMSKTVNLPKNSTIKDIKDTYTKAWELGLKSVTPFVDGSKGIQPVNIIQKSKKENDIKWGDRIKPESPTERVGWNVRIGETKLHFIIGEYNDRSPKDSVADYFVEFGSSGSPYSAVYTSWAKEASRSRQLGESLEKFIEHNHGATGIIGGLTDHPHIKTCSSIEDFFAKLILLQYKGDFSQCDNEPTPEEIERLRCNVLSRKRREQHYRSRIKFIDDVMREGKVTEIFPLYEDELTKGEIRINDTFCKNCGSVTVLSGANCRSCHNCGDATGCGG